MSKFSIYSISFIAMWILLFIKAIDLPIYFGNDYVLVDLCIIFSVKNCIAYFGFIMTCLALYNISNIFDRTISGSPSCNSLVIGKFSDVSIDYLNSFTTLITMLSVLLLDYNNLRDLFILIVVLIMLYICYITTNQYYSSPIFALLNYKIAKKDNDNNHIVFPKGSIILYKGILEEKSEIEIYHISGNVFFAKIIKKKNDSK